MAESKRHSLSRFIRDNAESLLTAIALALILRYFTIEAFKIPTGSMGVTLFGQHVWKKCPNCAARLPVSLPSTPDGSAIALPHVENFSYQHVDCPTCRAPVIVYEDFGSARCQCGARVAPTTANWTVVRGFRGIPGNQALLPLTIACNECQYRFNDFVSVKDGTSGDHLFVDKLYYKLVPPRRFDVFVFRFNREQNYIKRVVAFGGESVDIRNGDLYIKPAGEGAQFAIARKAGPAQDAVLRVIHDSSRKEKGYQKTPAWIPEPSRGAPPLAPELATWIPGGGLLEFNAKPLEEHLGGNAKSAEAGVKSPASSEVREPSAPPATEALARFGRQSTDLSPYNAFSMEREGQPVADRRIAFTAALPAAWEGGVLAVSMEDGPHTFQFEVPCGKKSGRPFRILQTTGGTQRMLGETPGFIPDERETALSFDNLDDALVMRVGGTVLLRVEVATDSPEITRNELKISVRNAQVRLKNIRIWRDGHYRSDVRTARQQRFPFDVPPGDFFALGDNSPNSADSRAWGRVPHENLVGKAFFIFWPLWPWDLRLQFIR